MNNYHQEELLQVCKKAVAAWDKEAETYERLRFSPRHLPSREIEPPMIRLARQILELA